MTTLSAHRIPLLLAGLALLCALPVQSPAQEASPPAKEDAPVFSVGAGMGDLTYFGDIGIDTRSEILSFAGHRFGIHLCPSVRLGNSFSLAAELLAGNLSKGERSLRRNLNFRTFLFQGGINAVYHLDNGYIMHRDAGFAPFLSAGIGVASFNPHGDLVHGASGSKYRYWSDGTIRNLDENASDASSAVILQRDFDYETELDSTGAQKNLALSLPLGGGITVKLSDRFHAVFESKLYYTLTDYIDHFSHERNSPGDNDMFIYTSVSLHYVFTRRNDEITDIDFSAIDNADGDGDGVPDLMDNCPGTPPGTAVDLNGCPADSDGDGVPDYRDEEAGTPAGVPVKPNGAAFTEEELAKIRNAYDNMEPDEKTSIRSVHPGIAQYTIRVGSYSGEAPAGMLELKGLRTEKSGDAVIFHKGWYADEASADEDLQVLKEQGFSEAAVVALPKRERRDIVVPDRPKSGTGSDAGSGADPASGEQSGETSAEGRVEYRVQIGAFREKVPESSFPGVMKVTSSQEGGLHKYYSGRFTTYAEARKLKEALAGSGYADLFVVAFREGTRISVQEALKISGE